MRKPGVIVPKAFRRRSAARPLARFALVGGVLGAIVMITLFGCQGRLAGMAVLVASGRPAKAEAHVRRVEPLGVAIDDFGLDLLRRAAARSAGGNTIVSPASVHVTLSMTANGATGETAAQMRKVLGESVASAPGFDQEWATLLGELESRGSSQKLDIANALWAKKGISFKQSFLDADRGCFGAQIATLDFAKDGIVGAINGWVSRNTHGMITQMVDEVDPEAALLLSNAVYFKGKWATAFEHDSTQPQRFTRADGSTVMADMMSLSDQLPYAESATLQATKLLYKGGDTAFYVLLPKRGVSLDAAAASLEATGFSDLRQALASNDATRVVLGLPKLDADFSASLREPLIAMGMPRAFDEGLAQFSGMAESGSGQRIFIDEVLHKTKVKVDETGTEAAAATVVAVCGSAAVGVAPQPVSIICDRPYLFAIVDERSGAMLFLGAVNDPTR